MIQSLKMAMKSIGGNKLRACLTMLGIIIGVMTLVVLVSMISGTTDTVTDTISSLGNNLLTVTISDGYTPSLTLTDLEEWEEDGSIGSIAPFQSESMTGKYGSSSTTLQVYGVTASYYDLQQLSLEVGRFIKNTDVDNRTYVCVLTATAAETLVGYTDCVGTEISLDGVKLIVVGVLEDNDSSLTSALSGGSSAAYVAYSTLARLTEDSARTVSSFYVSAADGLELETAETAVTELLYTHFEDDDAYSVSSMSVIEEAMSSITSALKFLLGGIAAVSLVVGGIGIMNIMLVTVTERTREIGIRKAIGASRGAILLQFLMESVVLCMMGCAIGIFLSWGLIRIVTVVVVSTGLSFSLNGGVVAIAVAFCVAIGLIFGLYPANKAAKMPPIDALHYGG